MSETNKKNRLPAVLSELDKQVLPLQGEVDPKQAATKVMQAVLKATRRFMPPLDKK